VDLELFSRGGMAILEKIRGQNYNVLASRPSLGAWDRASLFARAVWRVRFRSRRAESSLTPDTVRERTAGEADAGR
jgi:hypothetical protein